MGTLVLRHGLTNALAEVRGHIGYHVVAPWRRQGHATRMLSLALVECRALGLERVLLTCDPSNEPSRRVIVANGGSQLAGPAAKTTSGSPWGVSTAWLSSRQLVP